MMAVGAGSVAAQKSSSPSHLDHLLAGTLKDEVKRREKRRMKEEKKRGVYNNKRRFVFSAASSVEISGTPESEFENCIFHFLFVTPNFLKKQAQFHTV